MATWLRNPPVRLVAFIDQAVVSAGNFIAGILMARAFGAHEFGSFTLAWLIVEFMASLQFASVIQPMLNVGAKEDEADRDRYYSAIAIQQAVLGVGAGLLIWAAVTGVGSAFVDEPARLALALCIATASFQGYNFFRRYFFVRGRPGISLMNDILRLGLQIGGIVALPLLWLPVSAEGGIWVAAAACGISTLVGIALFGRFEWDSATFRRLVARHWTFSKWLLPSAVMYWMTSQAFVLMSGIVLGAAATGALKAAISIVGIIALFVQALDNFAPMQASQAFQRGGREALLRYLVRLGLFTAAVLGSLVLLLSSDTDFVVQMIYGQAFEGLGYMVHWLCATMVVYALSVLLTIWAAAIERTQLIFVSYVAATLFTIVAAYPLTSKFGMQGVLLGALIVEVIKALALFVPLVRWRRKVPGEAFPVA